MEGGVKPTFLTNDRKSTTAVPSANDRKSTTAVPSTNGGLHPTLQEQSGSGVST